VNGVNGVTEGQVRDTLTPLPKRVADELVGGDHPVVDPIEFVDQLLDRAALLLSTLQSDVAGLEADQQDERIRIEQDWQRQQEAVDETTDRLARMQSHARQIAAHKARLAEFEAAVAPAVPSPAPESVTVEELAVLMATIDLELKAARGITGSIRLPRIAGLLDEAGAALARLAEQADATRQQMLTRTEDDLDAEGTEARASFEIGLGVLQRDLEGLERALPLGARSWDDAGWDEWQLPEGPQEWVRVGVQVNSRLPDAPIPLLMPATCGPGLLIQGGPHRDLAVDGACSLVLRLLASLPAGMARFTFIDAKAMGETVAPFLALVDYDAALVGDGALVLEDEIERQLERLTRHVERVIKHCLQGRYRSLDDYHEAIGEVVEPYRYLVVVDHPTGFTDRSTALLRALIESGPRCGVTTIVVRAPRSRPSARAEKGLPALPTVRSTPDGLVVDSTRSGPWSVRPDNPPLLALGVGSADAPSGIYERIITEAGTRGRAVAHAPVTLSAVFGLVAAADGRRVRNDLPVTAAPVDPDDPDTWWTGDATTGIGAPIGRTAGRAPVSPWFDESHAGMVVTGPSRAGVSTLLRTLIDAVVVQYPPEECQVLLVGLGDRSTFAAFGDEGLPHARLVASEAERELGLSVLEACDAIVERRRVRLEVSGTQRFGLSGHRTRTGERLPRLLLALDGVGELFAADDTTASTASRLLAHLATEGPTLGVHLLLADRVSPAEGEVLLAQLPNQFGVQIRVGEVDEDGTLGRRHEAAIVGLGAGGASRVDTPSWFRVATTPDHQRAVMVRDLGRLARRDGFVARPQVVRGDRGGELPLAPLAQLTGDTDRRGQRRTPRLWLGEPVGLGPPVEVTLRRQEGANLIVVSDDPGIGPGTLFAAVATASIVHDRSLEVWVVDFLPPEAGFGALFVGLGSRSTVHVGRRRNLAKALDTVHRIVQDRLVSGEVNGPPRLLVVNGLGRAHDLDAGSPGERQAGSDTLDPVQVLETILRDGPEVGVHTLVWCDTVETLHRRLGPDALREFGMRVGSHMEQDDSVALLDSTYATTLRGSHALLYDEDRGRLVKLRPYALPPDGWVPPV
jgi:S-DNA-T family DNA segregation ATPase FtsK/SpoIIIE